MRPITLTKIIAEQQDPYADSDDPSENTQTVPVTINADAIRCFYPRRDNKPGTRITFTDGGGFAVSDSYEVVSGLCGS